MRCRAAWETSEFASRANMSWVSADTSGFSGTLERTHQSGSFANRSISGAGQLGCSATAARIRGESSFARRSRALGGRSASGSMISTNASRLGSARAVSAEIFGVDALDAARYRVVVESPAPTLRRRARRLAAQAHAQSGWIWQLNSIACQFRQSVPRTRRDDPRTSVWSTTSICCSPHTQG